MLLSILMTLASVKPKGIWRNANAPKLLRLQDLGFGALLARLHLMLLLRRSYPVVSEFGLNLMMKQVIGWTTLPKGLNCSEDNKISIEIPCIVMQTVQAFY